MVECPRLQLPNSWMFLLSELPFSLAPERSTKEIEMANGKRKAQGPEETDRQQDRLVSKSVKQSDTESSPICVPCN